MVPRTIVWFNDKAKNVKVYKDNLMEESLVASVKPQSYVKFVLDITDQEAIFIKEWSNNTVLVTRINKDNLK